MWCQATKSLVSGATQESLEYCQTTPACFRHVQEFQVDAVLNREAAEQLLLSSPTQYDAIVEFEPGNVAHYTIRMNATEVADTRVKLNVRDNQPDRCGSSRSGLQPELDVRYPLVAV